jgi:hypothetical protein
MCNCEEHRAQCELLQRALDATRLERDAAEVERDTARAYARILAHSYEHDSRPPSDVVERALAFPVGMARELPGAKGAP